jgi:hypothetical protein
MHFSVSLQTFFSFPKTLNSLIFAPLGTNKKLNCGKVRIAGNAEIISLILKGSAQQIM